MLLKKIICTVLASFLCVAVFALDPFHIDINAEFGIVNGEINEYVFRSPIADTEYILSRLDWDVKFVKYAGASVDVVVFEHFYIGLSGRLGFHGSSGNMQDYDWMNVESHPEYNWLTNYSKHDNYLTKYLDGTVKVGGIIKLPFGIFIMPSVSLQSQEFAFDGLNGYYQYAPSAGKYYSEWNEDITKKPFSGKVISYNQQRLFFFSGLKIYTTIVPRFLFEMEGNYSPFTAIGALDTHWLRNFEFLDQPKGLGTWNVSGKIQFSFRRFCKLALTCDYQCVPFLTGNSYSKRVSSDLWSIQSGYLGGASSKIFSFSFMATLFF